MSRGPSKTPARDRAARPGAFEVEIEVFWCSTLDRLPAGRSAEAWLWLDWTLHRSQDSGSRMVGVFTRDMPLSDFRDACFATLEELR